MKQNGLYGQNVQRYLHLERQPSSLITRSLRNAEIAVTEVLDDNPVEGPSGQMDIQDAYMVGLKLYDYPNAERWERGGPATKIDIRAGSTHLYDMKKNPSFIINQPLHFLIFYLPRSALNSISEQFNAPRVGELPSQLGTGHDDPIIRHIGGRYCKRCVGRPRPTSSSSITRCSHLPRMPRKPMAGCEPSARCLVAVSPHGR